MKEVESGVVYGWIRRNSIFSFFPLTSSSVVTVDPGLPEPNISELSDIPSVEGTSKPLLPCGLNAPVEATPNEKTAADTRIACLILFAVFESNGFEKLLGSVMYVCLSWNLLGAEDARKQEGQLVQYSLCCYCDNAPTRLPQPNDTSSTSLFLRVYFSCLV